MFYSFLACASLKFLATSLWFLFFFMALLNTFYKFICPIVFNLLLYSNHLLSSILFNMVSIFIVSANYKVIIKHLYMIKDKLSLIFILTYELFRFVILKAFNYTIDFLCCLLISYFTLFLTDIDFFTWVFDNNSLMLFAMIPLVTNKYSLLHKVLIYLSIIFSSSILIFFLIQKNSIGIFISYFGLVISLYLWIYNYYKINYTISSFISTFITVSIMSSYMLLFYNIVFFLNEPIFLENISLLSQYRYLILVITSVFGLFFLLYNKVNPRVYDILLKKMQYLPSPKEEIRIILYNYNDSWLGNICVKLTHGLYYNRFFKYLFFFFHVILFIFFRIIILLLFISFTFYHMDLRYLLYLAPINFIIWILDLYYYYFLWFITVNTNGIKDLLHSSFRSGVFVDSHHNLIKINRRDDIILSLTTFAIDQGFKEDDLPYLKEKFIVLGSVNVLLMNYSHYFTRIKYSIFLFNFICWSFIVSFFFFTDAFLLSVNIGSIFSQRPFFVPRLPFRFHNTGPVYARDLRFVKKPHQPHVESESNGAYRAPHPVIGEENVSDKTYRVDTDATAYIKKHKDKYE